MARRTDRFARAAALALALSGTLMLSAMSAGAQAPGSGGDTAAAQAPPRRPPDPVFDDPNTDPRDFEGLWLPGRPRVVGAAPRPARGSRDRPSGVAGQSALDARSSLSAHR